LPIGALESPTDQPSPTQVATAASTKNAASSSSPDRLTRLVELLLGAAVLLGIGGGYGLYATSDRRR
jgi:hypothetical protein